MRYYDYNPDLRRIRATRFTASIMQEIGTILDRVRENSESDIKRDIHEAIYELIWRSGADIITDHDRKDAGLQDRGNTGYTAQELQILEARRLEIMLKPFPHIFELPETSDEA